MPDLQDTPAAREERAGESVRSLLGCDVKPRVSDIITNLDRIRDEAIAEADRKHSADMCFAFNQFEEAKSRCRHDDAITEIRRAHAASIASVQQWDAERIHAQFETRDEQAEATEAATALLIGGGRGL